MKIALHLLTVIYIWYLATLSQASDCPLQDFCVAVNNPMPPVFVNGRTCKDPNMVTADDFFFSGLNKPGNYDNTLGHRVTRVYANQLPGLNTLGISLIRIDIAPYGLDPPHTHPRASEVLHVFEGTLYVGFVTSNVGGKYRLFTKILYAGDVFVFPQGLIHFEYNIGNTNAVVFGSLSSQNPGFINIAKDIFGSDPPIDPDVLSIAFQLDKKVIKYLQDRFSSGDI